MQANRPPAAGAGAEAKSARVADDKALALLTPTGDDVVLPTITAIRSTGSRAYPPRVVGDPIFSVWIPLIWQVDWKGGVFDSKTRTVNYRDDSLVGDNTITATAFFNLKTKAIVYIEDKKLFFDHIQPIADGHFVCFNTRRDYGRQNLFVIKIDAQGSQLTIKKTKSLKTHGILGRLLEIAAKGRATPFVLNNWEIVDVASSPKSGNVIFTVQYFFAESNSNQFYSGHLCYCWDTQNDVVREFSYDASHAVPTRLARGVDVEKQLLRCTALTATQWIVGDKSTAKIFDFNVMNRLRREQFVLPIPRQARYQEFSKSAQLCLAVSETSLMVYQLTGGLECREWVIPKPLNYCDARLVGDELVVRVGRRANRDGTFVSAEVFVRSVYSFDASADVPLAHLFDAASGFLSALPGESAHEVRLVSNRNTVATWSVNTINAAPKVNTEREKQKESMVQAILASTTLWAKPLADLVVVYHVIEESLLATRLQLVMRLQDLRSTYKLRIAQGFPNDVENLALLRELECMDIHMNTGQRNKFFQRIRAACSVPAFDGGGVVSVVYPEVDALMGDVECYCAALAKIKADSVVESSAAAAAAPAARI